jgi:hypothetical protein
MKKKTRAGIACLWIAVSLIARVSDCAPASDFPMVESVPEATIYGWPDVPRTQAVWLDMIGHAPRSIDIAASISVPAMGRGVISTIR